jgi:RHS repeat-associated protein
VHDDVIATANQAGTKTGGPFLTDPFGNSLSGGLPDNSAGNMDNAWLGQHQRPTEHEAGIEILIEMGARGYSPLVGRFLAVDSVEIGATYSVYAYVADPINQYDLTGKLCFSCTVRSAVNNVVNFVPTQAGAAMAWVGHGECETQRGATVCYGLHGAVTKLMPHTGLTLGNTILFKKPKSDIKPEFLDHEMSHVTQWAETLGFFPIDYAVAGFISWLTGTCNAFEDWADYGERYGC